MLFKIVLLFGFTIIRVLGESDCQPCLCCKDAVCPDNGNSDCYDGCMDGYRGNKCQIKCPPNCRSCVSDNECTSCFSGFFGETCSNVCPDKCLDNVCCIDSGYCGGCQNGFIGQTCNEQCPENCSEKGCGFDGHCFSCKPGYHGTFCNNKCPDRCTTCVSDTYCTECMIGYYNITCQNRCSNCQDGTPCSLSTGVCSSGCKDGWYNTMCQTQCSNKCISCERNNGFPCTNCKEGFYGLVNKCTLNCSSLCINNTCDGNSGTCTKGCATGFWGNTCNKNCSNKCLNYECFQNNGSCSAGCTNGFYGDLCDCPINCECNSSGTCLSCKPGFANSGKMCICKFCDNNTCSTCFNNSFYVDGGACCPCNKNCKNSICNSESHCSNGCESVFFKSNCSARCSEIDSKCEECPVDYGDSEHGCTKCTSGYYPFAYGANDYKPCKECELNCMNTKCDSTSGACLNGCSTLNRTGTHCDRNCSGTCKDNVCHWQTGECFRGCKVNYWGKHCERVCSEKCMEIEGTTICDESNGQCLAGCKEGYYSEYCDKNCSINCLNISCDNRGKCLYGCSGDFIDHVCLNVQGLGGAAITIGGSIGGAVALVVIILVVIFVIFIRRRKNRRHLEEHNLITDAVLFSDLDESVKQSDIKDYVYAKPVKREPKEGPTQPPTEINPVTSSVPMIQIGTKMCEAVCENTVIREDERDDSPAESGKNLSKEDPTPASATRLSPEYQAPSSSTRLSLAELTSQSHKVYVLELEDPDESAVSNFAAPYLENGYSSTESYVGETSYTNEAMLKRKISVGKLAEFVVKKTKDCFEEEFKNLPAGLIKPYTESQKQDNLTKNRYREVFPYDENRVVLKDGESDYINASFIDGYKKLNTYIASLGPTYKYMQDMSAFWRMVWQEKCGKIVMLTNLLEAGARKCDQYWPEKDCCKLYADINVTCLTEEIYVGFTVRNFNIQKNSEERNVVQIHFTAWPDKGVPDDVISLIEFRQKVNSAKTNLDGPILVHCSAGIGRTGSYIALDILTQEGEAEGNVDIYACVRNLREQRVNMVQTAEQYKYLHRAVVYSLTCDSHALDVTDFQRHMTTTGIETLAQQFQKLDHSVEKRSQDEEEAIVKNKALTEKNRIGADIPGDRNRLRLNLNLKPGACDYINAVYVNSYRRVNRYIVAQSPLQNTVVDFLTLVAQEKCSCVVSMEPETTKDSGVYFPADTHSWKRGSLIVRTEKVTSTQSFIHKRLKLSHHGKDPSEDRIVQHFQLTSWIDGKKCPDNAVSFLDFLHHVELKSGGAEAGPILVHCLTGAEKSGLLCVVAILLEKIQCDQQVSVVNTVRQVKSRRQRVIPNQEQYVFCHQCVNEYIQSFHIYSNFASRQ